MTPGTHLGAYEILGPIGAGGMGEVYRARDTKLNRDVALKVLPPAFAEDQERMARLQREAQTLASLNHSNIAQIYGMEGAALVMEFVPGANLTGPLPLDETMPIARQIADALEAAHEKGIVHRDLKPANIKVTPDGTVKVLDFGLARAISGEEQADLSNSPTMSVAATRAGIILGTASYMSPEQAKGKRVDARTDIWAFGCVLYEMLTGTRAFPGETAMDAMAAVISREPDWSLLPPGSPIELLKLCLQKDPRMRLRHIGDSMLLHAASGISQASMPVALPAAPPLQRAIWPYAAAAALALSTIVSAAFLLRATRPKLPQPLQRFTMEPTPDVVIDAKQREIAISPDGNRVAFEGRSSDGKTSLYIRSLDQSRAVPVAQATDFGSAFFSPDSQWLAFTSENKLKKVSAAGGSAITLADLTGVLGGDWGEDGYIYLAAGIRSPVMRILASGGALAPVTELRKEKNEVTHRMPHVSGQTLVFTSNSFGGNYEEADVEMQSLKTGARKTIFHGGYNGRYVPSGHLLYLHQGTLFAVAADPERMITTGQPVPILDDVESQPTNATASFAVGANGSAIYIQGKSTPSSRFLAWLDRAGKITPVNVAPADHHSFALSPDGKRFALSSQSGNGREIWIYDLERDVLSRLTHSQGRSSYSNPVWAPDGQHLAFYGATPGSVEAIFWMRADGSAEPVPLTDGQGASPASFSPDGKQLALTKSNHVFTVALDLTNPDHPKAAKPESFLDFNSTTTQRETRPMFSTDGHWIAYESTSGAGARDILVRPFPPSPSGGQWQVSTNQGRFPMWSSNGRELFYVSRDNVVMVVPYAVKNGVFVPDKARPWSQTPYNFPASVCPQITPDGKRIAALLNPEAPDAKPITHVTFLLNFFDELRRRAPKTNP